tara:strand:- start:2930 stop:3703 length:774 start_codon:yes stop_codon:yes gene_type:complete
MHSFFTFYIPWSNLSGAYVPEIYEQYTQDYIDLSKDRHSDLSKSFSSHYHFINNTRYCKRLFLDYNLPMIGHNDIFNIKFMLFDHYFKTYDKLTYIDFDVIQKGSPTSNERKQFLDVDCAIHYTQPLPGKGIHDKTTRLCELFDISPNREIWQNNNGVITISKDVWEQMDYINTIKEVYNRAGNFAVDICDETMFNFITIYKDIDVARYDSQYNTLVRRREEFDCHTDKNFRMFHFTKHTGKEVLQEELRNPSSILY